MLVDALLAPPTHVPGAAAEIARVAEDLGLLLADVGKGLRTGWEIDPAAGAHTGAV